MVKVSPYRSRGADDSAVYHDHDNCPAGSKIPAEDRVPGIGDRQLCPECRQIGLASPTSSG